MAKTLTLYIAAAGEYCRIDYAPDVERRMRTMNSTMWCEVELVHSRDLPAEECRQQVREVHARLSGKRMMNSWFRIDRRSAMMSTFGTGRRSPESKSPMTTGDALRVKVKKG